MPEPGNCAVKTQLGSTNSKGLPVLFQWLSPRNTTKITITSMLRGLRMVSIDLNHQERLHQEGELSPQYLQIHLCCRGRCPLCCRNGRTSTRSLLVDDKMPCNSCTLSCQYPSHTSLSPDRIAVERDPLQSCDPTNSLVSECLATTSRRSLPNGGDTKPR